MDAGSESDDYFPIPYYAQSTNDDGSIVIYENNPQERDDYSEFYSCCEDEDEGAEYEKLEQQIKALDLLRFRKSNCYGPKKEQRTCIWSDGTFSWKGMNKHTPPRPAPPYTEFRRQMAGSSNKGGPFAVVSVAPDIVVDIHLVKSGLQASHALNFLQESLTGRRSSLSSEETAKLPVYALKSLWGPKFNRDIVKAAGMRGVVNQLLSDMDLPTSFSSISLSSSRACVLGYLRKWLYRIK